MVVVLGARDKTMKHIPNICTGSVLILLLTTPALGDWTQIATLLAGNGTAGDQFGYSVSVSGDRAVIGVPNDDEDGKDAGVAFVFKRNGSEWVQVAKLHPDATAPEERFGRSVSISEDTIVVGAPGDWLTGAGAAYVYQRMGLDYWVRVAKLTASDGASGAHFGASVSISGDTIVIGAPDAEYTSQHSGLAYVFHKHLSSWLQAAKLRPSDGTNDDEFGRSVSISASGTTAVIGAPFKYSDGATGVVYVFYEPSGWGGIPHEDAQLRASDGALGDYLGYSVAVSDDFVVAGAYGDDDGGSSSGSAYVFEKPGSGWSGTINEAAKLLASDGAAYDYFGWSVSLSGDAVGIGAFHDDDNGTASGSVYAFVKPGGGWAGTLTGSSKLLANDGDNDDVFGMSVSMSDGRIVVGALSDESGADSGSAYVFEGGGLDWTQVAKLIDGGDAAEAWFGKSVSISGDTAVVGACGIDDNGADSGAAYVFDRTGLGWARVAKLLPSDGAAGDCFGVSVSISGNTIVVGADCDDDLGTNSGSAYVFTEPGGGWAGTLNEDAKLFAGDASADDHFGAAVSVSGDTIVVGAELDDDSGADSGSAYVFTEPVGGWAGTLNENAKLLAGDGAAGDQFGSAVSVSDDTVVIGAPSDDDNGTDSGSAYVFTEPSGGWAGTLNENAKLLAGDGAMGDQFGVSVSLSGDMVVIGAELDDDNAADAGSAYIFEKPGTGWAGTIYEVAKLLASDGAADDQLGNAVSISGNTVVVGAPLDDDNSADSGSAYVFEKPSNGWAGTLNEDVELLASGGAANDQFGGSVANFGDTIVVGASLRDANGTDSGSACVFVRPPAAGNLNCDDAVDNYDIDPFVIALTSARNAVPFDEYYALWPDCDPMKADINADGRVDNFDIDPFIALLTR